METDGSLDRGGTAAVVAPPPSEAAPEPEPTTTDGADVPKAASCASCGMALAGPYCSGCGQKAGPVDPTLGDLLQEHVAELLNVDGRVFRSVRLLLTQPGFLTAEHFRGRRAPYLSPLRLYLLFSVIYFTVAAFMPDPDADASDAAQAEWAPRVIFMLVPLAALIVRRAARSAGRHYPQHWYFVLHVHAAYFALLAVVTPFDLLEVRWLTNTLSVIQVALLSAYTTVAFRTAYGGTWRTAIGRAAFALIAYFVLFVSVIAVSVAVVVLIAYATAGSGSA